MFENTSYDRFFHLACCLCAVLVAFAVMVFTFYVSHHDQYAEINRFTAAYLLNDGYALSCFVVAVVIGVLSWIGMCLPVSTIKGHVCLFFCIAVAVFGTMMLLIYLALYLNWEQNGIGFF